jgi:hypothetical protein
MGGFNEIIAKCCDCVRSLIVTDQQQYVWLFPKRQRAEHEAAAQQQIFHDGRPDLASAALKYSYNKRSLMQIAFVRFASTQLVSV